MWASHQVRGILVLFVCLEYPCRAKSTKKSFQPDDGNEGVIWSKFRVAMQGAGGC